jgi:hypothetical protein
MMVSSRTAPRASCWLMPWFQFKVWQLALLVMLVAVATIDLREHGRPELPLLALAAGGYAGYFLIVWLSWLLVRRFQSRLGRTMLLGLYLAAMAALFLIATITYLVIEYRYIVGRSI